MSEIIIRQAELDELPRIAALKKQIHDVHVAGRPDLFTPYSSLDAFADHSAAKGCALLIAEEAGEPVGYVMYQLVCRPASPYMKERRFLHVEEFCVDENHQRLGIGRMLMEELKELARAAECPRIELDVWGFNDGAKQFYEAAGMKAYRTFMEMDV
ncbi:MAG: GNAT family N-acetyltransferase [Clostridia bacterium]|nr:GNAT family N-acetyltransferase [Clostridia bacterium]